MKKILLSLFGIITLGLINFSSAGTYTLTGTLTAGNCSNFNGTYNISVPNSYFVNSFAGNTSVSCGFLDDGGNITSAVFYQPTNQSFTINDSNYLISCPTGFSDYTCYGNLNGTLISYLKFIVNFHSYSSDNKCHLRFFCTFSGDSIINQSDIDSTCQSSLSSCQSDLTTCQNSSSSCSPSGQCSVSDKVSENIIFSGSKSFSNAGYTNMFNYGDYGAGTYCLKFTSSNPQTLTMGFANGGTTAPTNLYSLYNDQYGNTICLYGNKPYLNVKLNASSNTIDYEVYKLTDLLSDDIPCTTSSCDYSEYESQISTLSGNLATCEGLYDRLESDYDLLSGNYNSCTSELSSCLQNGGSSGSGDIQWSSLFINNIQHLGNENIFITIPEYLKFSYSNTGDDFELDIVGLEQDEEYLSGVINKLNYIPTTEDFSNVFSNFGLFGGLLVVCLFVIFVFYIIKKIFS